MQLIESPQKGFKVKVGIPLLWNFINKKGFSHCNVCTLYLPLTNKAIPFIILYSDAIQNIQTSNAD